MRNEKQFQTDVINYLKENKIYHYRTQMGVLSGLPDIICCVNGRFLGLELKREDKKGKASLQQIKVGMDIQNAGGVFLIIDSIEALKDVIDSLRVLPKPPIPHEVIQQKLFLGYDDKS